MGQQKLAVRAFQFLLALVCGYAAMVVLITVVQEVIFGGVGFYESDLLELLVAGALTTLSAVIGGGVAAMIYRHPWYPPALVMCVLVAIETTYLTLAAKLDGPLWFDVMASSSLVVGILLGAFLSAKLQPRHGTELAKQKS